MLRQVLAGGAREMVVTIPTVRGIRDVPIPAGAVVNAIAEIAIRAREELNAPTVLEDEGVPEYLIAEDGEYIVDPTRRAERAALVWHLIRLEAEAERYGVIPESSDSEYADDGESLEDLFDEQFDDQSED